jgi:hypothetical protein
MEASVADLECADQCLPVLIAVNPSLRLQLGWQNAILESVLSF